MLKYGIIYAYVQKGVVLLTDSKRRKEEQGPAPRRAVSAETNKRWSDTQKLEAATTYLMLGSIALTAATLKIPEVTIHSWKRSEWWQEIIKDIRSQENITLSNKLKKLVEKSFTIVEDRLDKGDYQYDQKTGKLVRKPVALKDAHRVTMDMLDRQQALTFTENVTIAEENVMSRLEKLAKDFESFADKQKERPVVQVTDVVFVNEQGDDDAIHEEREEGL